jgi:hypothetical protein
MVTRVKKQSERPFKMWEKIPQAVGCERTVSELRSTCETHTVPPEGGGCVGSSQFDTPRASEHTAAVRHRPAPWSLETRLGDAPLDLQDWVRRYVALVLEVEGGTARAATPPAPPEALVS